MPTEEDRIEELDRECYRLETVILQLEGRLKNVRKRLSAENGKLAYLLRRKADRLAQLATDCDRTTWRMH
jgi:hypothetical protein